MSSILTNTGAMVALQTMRGINKGMAQTQSEISTGKSINSARDNAAVWAISKSMQADVKGFSAISDSLALGRSTVAVATQAAETVTDLLTQMKGRIVAAQEENVDRGKIQTDIVALREQISTITSAAQFNGLNLLTNRENTAGSGTVNILSSLDRSSDGTVASANIGVIKQDLGTQATDWSVGTADAAGSGANISGALDAAAVVPLAGAATPNTTALVIDSAVAGMGVQINITGSAGTVGAAFNDMTRDVSYVARDGDTQTDVANGLANAFNQRVAAAVEAGTLGANTSIAAAVTVAANGVATVTFTGETGVAGDTFNLQAIQTNDVEVGGRLEALAEIDVSNAAGARSALTEIEGLIQTAIDSAAAFGSAQTRIDTQAEFIKNLSDALTTGIGSLVDADMEAASARLQALQVQQQLATQSLSIANQQPQNILALFR
ncbi:flagellin [Roseinatronobacter alkalisoli]|uniref:Flagellin n=1 Tax=Roseinatronobacter alkalisoli TaxID=3028235 RepID=A0ABT5TC35_9RHOB|nr:flagellin [Roseinatronobacter sp. HJB301]MDD7971732.1 flagellin [Roseinatronobacter sp. HJB301]